MEICVNEYARINKDFRITCLGIGKVVNKNQNTIYIKISNNDLPIAFNVDSITKHSFNIIDLIECGDYVNGHLVIDIDKERLEVTIENMDWDVAGEDLKENEIKSIVTRESFNSIKYEVK